MKSLDYFNSKEEKNWVCFLIMCLYMFISYKLKKKDN